MCCSWFASDPTDYGLCLYTCLCSTCATAEISKKIGSMGLCDTRGCFEQWLAAYCVALVVTALGSFCFGIGSLLAPWVWSLYQASVREAFTKKYQLPPDELCCDSFVLTFQPMFICCYCTPCALYQQAYVLKHRAGIDLDCCCYKYVCSSCALPMDPVQQSMSLNRVATVNQPMLQQLA